MPMTVSSIKQSLIERSVGPVVALNIPFLPDGDVDYEDLQGYVDFLCESDAKTILMTYGSTEYGVLSDDEIYEITRVVGAAVRGRCNFIAASKCWSVNKTVAYIRYAKQCGASAVKVQPNIFTANVSETALFDYYERICKQTDFPIWAYTGIVNGATPLVPDTIARLAAELPNIYAMKTDGEMMYAYFDMIQASDNIMIVSGGQMKTMLYGYQLGSKAYLCPVAPLFPHVANRFFSYLEKGDTFAARTVMMAFEVPILRLCKQMPWLALAKGMLHCAGHFKTSLVRLPGTSASAPQLEEIKYILRDLQDKAQKIG